MSHKSAIRAALLAVLAGAQTGAFAADDTWLVRVRGIAVAPNDDSSLVSVNGASVAGSGVGVDTAFVPELDITYKITPHIGAELILATSQHNVTAEGATEPLGEVIDTWVLPPTLTLQYHFNPEGQFRPYVGAGVNYTVFYSEEVNGGLDAPGASVDIDPSWGYALQVGADFEVSDRWFLNLDLKYIDIGTDADFRNAAGGVDRASVDVDIDPFVVGFGVGYRF